MVAASLAVLGGCATTRRPPSRTDSLVAAERLQAVAQDTWRFMQGSRPDLFAKAGGVVDALPDPTQDRLSQDARFARAALSALDQILVDALTEDAYVTWQSLRWDMEAMSGWPAFYWTRLSDLAPGHSVFDRSLEILQSQTVRDRASAVRYLELVSGVADLARSLQRDYAERERRGITLPAPIAARAMGHVRDLVAPADASPFRAPADFTVEPDSAWHAEFVRGTHLAIEQNVNPALISLADFLERELEVSADTLSMSRLPGGAVHYATLLRYHSTVEVNPADAHAFGLSEVMRIAALAADARARAGLPVSRDSLRAALRETMNPSRTQGLIAEQVAMLLQLAITSLDTAFLPAPTMLLAIGPLPLELEPWRPLAVYDGARVSRPSARYLLNISALESRSPLRLPGLVLADLMPGLHLLAGSQFENTARMPYRRFAAHEGFVRGWQAYVLDAAGPAMGRLSAAQQFGVRLQELAAACGLVVDTGINAFGWSRADALAFLRAWLPDDDADLERDIVWPAVELPGVLAAGPLGAREFRGLRRWAERELGERFRLSAFHAEVLRTGSVPLPVLGTHLERWIWELNNPPLPPAPRSR